MYIGPPLGLIELDIYVQWLRNNGINPSVLKSTDLIIDKPLLLCGGPDIGVNKKRDRLEFNWIRSAIENKQPIIGVCRGMQILNVYFGGMVKSLNETNTEFHRLDSFEDDSDHVERVSQYHLVKDHFENILMVNSRHHQYCSKVAKNFKVTYTSLEGGFIPEAFEDKIRNIYGVQWHPERMESENNIFPLNMIITETK